MSNNMKRAVFLDRDGVINQAIIRNGKPYPPTTLAQLIILPEVYETLQNLHDSNFLIIVITNQPDVARGITKKDDVESINSYLLNQLPIDDLKTCYHDTQDKCTCRKPLPGALLEAAKSYKIDLSKSFMVGDRWSDIEAGSAAGCKTIFINYYYAEQKPATPDYIVTSLQDAKKVILGEF